MRTDNDVDASTPLTTDIDITEKTEDSDHYDVNIRHADVSLRIYFFIYFVTFCITCKFCKLRNLMKVRLCE